MLRWYQGALARRPVFTQVATTAVLFGAGDILAQQAVEKKGAQKHDYFRTTRMIGYGAVVFGPAATYWYKFLQNRITLSTKTRTTLARVGLDQFVFTPINLTFFLSTMAVLEGFPAPKPQVPQSLPSARDIKAAGKELKRDAQVAQKGAQERVADKLDSTLYTALTKNWLVWPWVQIANFSVVPLEHRVLVVNIVALGWNCYLSYLNSGGGQGKKEE